MVNLRARRLRSASFSSGASFERRRADQRDQRRRHLRADADGKHRQRLSSPRAAAGLLEQPAVRLPSPAGAPAKIVLTEQPGDTTAGTTISTVIATIEDGAGQPHCNASTETITLASNPATALGGTVSVAAINGTATFSDLSITGAGSYTLTASGGSYTSATSNSFTISPAAASQLVFAQQPGNTSAGASTQSSSTSKTSTETSRPARAPT